MATRWWWYFDPIAYVLNPSVQAGHDAVRFLSYSLEQPGQIFWTLGLALLGIFGFADLRRRRVNLELLAPFMVIVAGFMFLLIKSSWVNVRILPFVALVLQLGLVTFLIEPMESRLNTIGQMIIMIAVCISLLWGGAVGGGAYLRAYTYINSDTHVDVPQTWSNRILSASKYGESLVPEGSVAIAHAQTAFPMEATSLSVVAIPRLFAGVPDMLVRQADNVRFFDAGTSTVERCAIVMKYDVSLIVWRDVWISTEAERDLLLLGNRTRYADLSFIAAGAAGFENCRPQSSED